ncbi:MAG: tyrosine-type recombinase/integrase [Pirellulaceae bacterium]|nr:tyrosine-type recombinase/integrase [Pirellulaceae bacterium]
MNRKSPLRELIDAYMLASHGKRSKPPGDDARRKLNKLLLLITETVSRRPVVSDLSPATLAELSARWGASGEFFESIYLALWRYAGELGLAADAPALAEGRAELSEDTATLWGICLAKFFPANLRIRSEATREQYRYALKDFRDFLHHDPTAADLDDDVLSAFIAALVRKGLAVKTANERSGRIACLWNWLARRNVVKTFPTFSKLREPRRTPKAWTQEEIGKLFRSCDTEGGHVAGIKARSWWTALHYVLWNSGARLGEILSIRWEWVNLTTGAVHIPGEFRKGGLNDAFYRLSLEALESLEEIRLPIRELVFPWDRAPNLLWGRYKKILERAGLPAKRCDMFHKIRRSVASHMEAAGHSSTRALGHASAETTRKSYLDPEIVSSIGPASVLFQPFDTGGNVGLR